MDKYTLASQKTLSELCVKHEETIDDLLRERNELAAHVERLRGVVVAYYTNGVCVQDVKNILDETPAQSLEAVKREWEQELVKESEKRQREIISTMIDVERISKDPSAPIVDRLMAIGERLWIKS